MTNKLEISRELADRLTRAYPAEITDQETMQAIRIEALSALDELRALLAAPAVERQEPVRQVRYLGGYARWLDVDAGTYDELKDDKRYEPRTLYTSPPAPVAVVLPERMEDYDVEKHPAYLHGWNACLDKVKEMNK
jgi:hypothetical protein